MVMAFVLLQAAVVIADVILYVKWGYEDSQNL